MKYNRYQNRDAIKNYFPLPNEVFCLGLTYGELAVYSYLMYCENRKTFKCYPSYKTIGNAIGMNKNTVRKYVKSLEDKQLISTQPTTIIKKDGHKQNGNLLYTILPIDEAINHYYEKQMIKLEEDIQQKRIQTKLKNSSLKCPKKQFENGHKNKQVKVRGLPAQITSDGRADR